MNLALYSGGPALQNRTMNEDVVALIRELRATEIVFITTPKDKVEYATNWIKEYFLPYLTINLIPIFVDAENSPENLQKLAEAKVVLFTGGNTFYLLKYLKESVVSQYLLELTKKNVLFIGFSAGALIQTPTIATAVTPSYDRDENSVGLTDLKGLSLVKYELHVHYKETVAEDAELRQYSLKTPRPIYALHDGDGIFTFGQKERMYGNIVMFDRGEKIKVACNC